MADTPQTLAALIAAMPNNTTGAISEQIMRNFLVSVNRMYELYTSTSYANDTDAAAGGVPVGQIYRNGNFLMVRLT